MAQPTIMRIRCQHSMKDHPSTERRREINQEGPTATKKTDEEGREKLARLLPNLCRKNVKKNEKGKGRKV